MQRSVASVASVLHIKTPLPRPYQRMISFFLLLLFKERDRRGSIDSSRLREDNQGTARQLVSSEYRHVPVSLTGESGSGKLDDSSKCLGSSVDFELFWSYIPNLYKEEPSLSEFHAHNLFD